MLGKKRIRLKILVTHTFSKMRLRIIAPLSRVSVISTLVYRSQSTVATMRIKRDDCAGAGWVKPLLTGAALLEDTAVGVFQFDGPGFLKLAWDLNALIVQADNVLETKCLVQWWVEGVGTKVKMWTGVKVLATARQKPDGRLLLVDQNIGDATLRFGPRWFPWTRDSKSH